MNKKAWLKKLLSLVIRPIKYILFGVGHRIHYVINSFHQSIRRKIALEYLMIYSVIALLTILVVPTLITVNQFADETQQLRGSLSQLLDAYSKDVYTRNELEQKLVQLTQSEQISFEIQRRQTQQSQIAYAADEKAWEILITTGKFTNHSLPRSIFERFRLFFREHLIFHSLDELTFADQQELTIYRVGIFYSLDGEQSQIFIQVFILSAFLSVGFLLIWLLGNYRVDRVLKPISTMNKTAKEVSIKNLSLRLDVESTKYELKDLAMTFNEMLDRLDKDYEKQKRFVSDVSHELRTPISIIDGYASMLKRWGMNDQEILEESIDAIMTESKNMQFLVENLLTLVRSDNQTLQFENTIFDMTSLLCMEVKQFTMMNQKDQYITCESEQAIYVYMDQNKLRQMMRIFLDNAVKYTSRDGSIRTIIYVKENSIELHIKDSGIGIAKEDLSKLFDRFYRSDESRTRETGGHGLGLSIAKVIILSYGGKIRVKSKIGVGSEFIIIFPKSRIYREGIEKELT